MGMGRVSMSRWVEMRRVKECHSVIGRYTGTEKIKKKKITEKIKKKKLQRRSKKGTGKKN
mgnify:CR=1 FL=1